MPKHLIISIIYIILGLLSSCQSEYNDHVSLHLKGRVKELRVRQYKAKEQGGKIQKMRLVSYKLDGPNVYGYDELPINCKVQFDEQKAISVLDVYDNTDQLHYTMHYKDTIWDLLMPNQKLMRQVHMDDRWRPHYKNTYTPSGALFNTTRIAYDKEESLSAVHKEYNGKNELLGITEYVYEKELLQQVKTTTIKTNRLYADKPFRVEKIKYDACQHPSEVIIDEGGVIKVITMEYTLDKQHNWTQAVEYVNGKAKRLVERTLVYY